MKISFLNGWIVADGFLYEDVPYDVSANNLSVCFDGKGGLSKYLSVRSGKNYLHKSRLSLFKDGERIGAYTKKQTKMAGRIQENVLFGEGYRIEITQFITRCDDAVFMEFAFFTNKESNFEFALDTGDLFEKSCVSANVDFNNVGENFNRIFSVKVSDKKRVQLVVSYEENQEYCDNLVSLFNQKLESARNEISQVVIPSSAKTEEEKALYLSALFCCIENYKECGKLKGFVAGCNYLNPVRTYYRDSYWTVLPMYSYDISYVKRQICTLAHGISKDGTCPSAVKQDFSAFWGGHYDSPSFFVMMVYDYVNHSGDVEFLSYKINGSTVLDLCILVVTKQMERTDETGLLYKDGKFNKLDWADEVNRNGYVTYDEALYYRALYCVEKLCIATNKDGSVYRDTAKRVKDKINEILWSEEKGYYVNYIDGDFVEDNLSVDTVLTYLFGIADKDRSEKMLTAMENILETKNNHEQQAGDYGVMCVYPFYKKITSTCIKSSQDYEYHNGANWPYWSAIYAYAKYLAGKDYKYPLESWFSYNLNKGKFTPVEYFSPCRNTGSTLQAWSGVAAFVFDFIGKPSFFNPDL